MWGADTGGSWPRGACRQWRDVGCRLQAGPAFPRALPHTQRMEDRGFALVCNCCLFLLILAMCPLRQEHQAVATVWMNLALAIRETLWAKQLPLLPKRVAARSVTTR